MQVVGTDGKKYILDTRQINAEIKNRESCRSKLQYDVGQYLRTKYPLDIILEDFYIESEGLYLDFFLPKKRIVIEIDGPQHNKYIPFFHKNIKGFNKSKILDRKKNTWCEMNNFIIIRVNSLDDINV